MGLAVVSAQSPYQRCSAENQPPQAEARCVGQALALRVIAGWSTQSIHMPPNFLHPGRSGPGPNVGPVGRGQALA